MQTVLGANIETQVDRRTGGDENLVIEKLGGYHKNKNKHT